MGVLDELFWSRIGSNVLLSQYLACIDENRPHTGIIDPECDVAQVCKSTAKEIQRTCIQRRACCPAIDIHAYCADGTDVVPQLSYIPVMLGYIMQELLKNSCRATIESCVRESDLDKRPIKVLVCADERRVIIQVSDQAGGIPFDVGQHVWDYMYTTADEDATELAGYGVGLPLSR